MQKRLERQAESMRRKHEAEIAALRAQLTPQQTKAVENAAQNFQYDPDSEQSVTEQLETFIEQTITKLTTKRYEQEQQLQEQKIQAEFEEKLVNGMQRFHDFRDVLSELPCEITNPMTYATRAMTDPAAFLYAAAKRHPEELERISKMRDPYAQIAEMGKLEERMRRNKPTTKAPRPLGRTPEDASIPVPKNKKEESIEDLIAKSDSKRLAQLRQKQRIR